MSSHDESVNSIVCPVMRADDAERAWKEYLELCSRILTDDDYVYYVRYFHAGEESIRVFNKREDAEALVKKLAAFPKEYRSVELLPRKKRSAWDKLARFFGLTVPAFGPALANIEVSQVGKYIIEKRTGESFVLLVYRDAETLTTISASATVAVRAPNGRTAIGEAACSASERPPGKKPHVHPDHDIVSTAWTRALNRAISRCIGAGEVSAEEIEDREDSAVESNPQNSGEAASSDSSLKGSRLIAGSDGVLPASAPVASLGATERAAADSPASPQTAAASATIREVAAADTTNVFHVSQSAAAVNSSSPPVSGAEIVVHNVAAADTHQEGGGHSGTATVIHSPAAATTKFQRLKPRDGNPPKLIERIEHMQKWLYGKRAVSLTNRREDRIIWYMLMIADDPLQVKLESVHGRLDTRLWDAAIKKMPPEERLRRVAFLETAMEELFDTPEEFRRYALAQIEQHFGKINEGGTHEDKSTGTA